MDINIIKLIIWDLDDTFWKGTLSEGEIVPIPENLQLVKDLTDRGIVNAICSKNDKAPVVQKLKELGIEEYFVFNSIDWTPKGERVARLISDMGLRPVNVLFIDDNVVNLNEAAFYSPELMIAEPDVLADIIKQIDSLPAKDKAHSRLKNYMILEEKRDSKSTFGDNEAFLYSTNTHVDIHHDCIEKIDRIHELIMRTNQLNFTKNRMPLPELEALLLDPDVDSGYVHVSDRFGDYGIVGFYAIKNGKCIHFLFSCRTIGQGVEQYVYSILNWPKLVTVGTVINEVQKVEAPKWINQEKDGTEVSTKTHEQIDKGKIVFKGACDLMIMTSFFESSLPIIEEFTYQGNRHNEIEHHNHSTNFISLPFLSEKERQELMDDCIFNDEGIFKTTMYDDDVKLLFISSLPESNLGIYRKKGTDIKIAFAEWTNPLTDKQMWSQYVNKDVHAYMNDFTEEWLRTFSEKYEFLGRITPEEYVDNIRTLLTKISPDASVCLLLGCETEYKGKTTKAYLGRELYHKEMNDAIRKFAEKEKRLFLIDWTEFVHSQEDFTNNINHYRRQVYYQASLKASEIIANVMGEKIKKVNIFKRYLSYLGATYTNKINRNSWWYPIVRDTFHWLADKRK